MRLWVQSLALLSGLGIRVAMSCGVGGRHGSDPALLWLWRRPAAVALIQPLALELPYAEGTILKKRTAHSEMVYDEKNLVSEL